MFFDLIVPEDEKIGRNRCWVEFDDGDSGEFPLPDVRMIPPDFPQEGTGNERYFIHSILFMKSFP